VQAATLPPGDGRAARPRLYWWKEAAIIVAFYALYSLIRNQLGSERVSAGSVGEQAFNNAMRVIQWERWMGLYHEESIQDFFLGWNWLIKTMNVYYGTAHFVVTIGVFILLYWKRPWVFPQWRNALAFTTAFALVGFRFFPLMPPRLLDVTCEQFGGACIESGFRGPFGFGYVDTLAEIGGLWSFDSGGLATISNQYAAMPSLHIGWSAWCAVAMWPLLRRRWHRAVVLGYPLLTLFCIVVTANHFWLDGAGGLAVFLVGLVAGWGLHRWNIGRQIRRELTAPPTRHSDREPVTASAAAPGGGSSPGSVGADVARANPRPG